MIEILDKKGEQFLLISLGRDTPPIENDCIRIEVPSEIDRVEISSQKKRFLNYIRRHLNNYGITMDVIHNRELVTTLAYTPQEKYEALKEQNPYLEDFIRELELEL